MSTLRTIPDALAPDWTVDPDTGAFNASMAYEHVTHAVSRLIKDSAHDLVNGRTDMVARLIVSQLTVRYGMAPSVPFESFRPRGIGTDSTPGCFVCGGEKGDYSNIAGFVMGRAGGERVVAMFERGARLDFRDFEPHWVQVKIGACATHLPNLERLYELTREWLLITTAIVQDAVKWGK